MKLNKSFCLSLFILFSQFIIQSCKKDNTETEIHKFPMVYLIRNNGDDNLTGINVHTWTTFPIENETAWIGRGKQRDPRYINNKDLYLKTFDSIFISPDLNVYKGCTRYMKVRLWFNKVNLFKYRDYEFTVDTVNDKNDSRLVINWPEDSSKFSYTEDSYTNK